MYSELNFLKQKTTTFLLFCVCLWQIGLANIDTDQPPTVSVNLINVTLPTIFDQIERQTSYRFSYGESIIDDTKTYSISYWQRPLFEVLELFSKKAGFDYIVKQKQILIKRNKKKKEVIVTKSRQNEIIKGVILDENGNPLSGVNVLELGTDNGVISDFDGEFNIQLKGDNGKLVFSFIGYISQEVLVTASNMNIQMAIANTQLEQVVLVGYGSQRKSSVTGVVVKLEEEDFRKGVNTSADNLLQGKVAGVRVLNTSGEPGAGVDITIRGAGSIRSGNRPLFVVDGVPLDNDNNLPAGPDSDIGRTASRNPLNFLNPDDIESIDILKDASATAIYGSRGSNGVIIISTKKGTKGTAKFNVNSYVGFAKVANKIDLLSAIDYARENPQFIVDPNTNTDWQDEIFRIAVTTNNNFSMSKGSDTGSFYASIGNMKQEGVIEESQFQRTSARLNVQESFLDNERLKTKINLTVSETKDDAVPNSGSADARGELLTHTLYANPTIPVFDENGELFTFQNDGSFNPLYLLSIHNDKTKTQRILGNIETNFRIFEGFEYKFNFALDRSISERNTTFLPNLTEIEADGAYYQQNLESRNRLIEHYFTYYQKFGNHIFNALAGYSYQKFRNEGTTFGFNHLNDSGVPPSIKPLPTDLSENFNGGFAQKNELQSFFARLNYDFDNKYLITITGRYDGTTRTGQNKEYGFFPSVSLGWNIANEEFFRDSNTVTELKLRAGWGQTGNQEVPNKVTKASYSVNPSGGYIIDDGGEFIDAIQFTRTANPNLQWEVVTQTSLGMEFNLFNSKLYGTIDYFNKATTNLILQIPSISPSTTDIWINLDAEIVNKGFEMYLGSEILKTEHLKWNIDINGATLNSEIKDLVLSQILTGVVAGPGLSGATTNIYTNGAPIGSFFMLDHIGFDENGVSTFRDVNNNGVNGDPGDRTLMGSAIPDVTFGINNSFSYKDFDFSFSLTGQLGGYLFNNTKLATSKKSNLNQGRNLRTDVFNSGESVDDSAQVSDLYLESSDFLRLNNASIGYNFNSENVKWFDNIRVYVTGQNLFTITDYSGYDPAVNTSRNQNGVISFGIDYVSYPTARTFILGTSVKL